MTSWKPEVTTHEDDQWSSNALRFGTREEALGYAADLRQRWYMVVEIRAVTSDDAVNHRWSDERRLERIEA